MSSWRHGAGFRACGVVVRRFTNQAGTFAALTLEVPGEKRIEKHEYRAFREMVGEVGALGVGQTVEITGSVDFEALTDKKRNDVKVDGFPVWVAKLTIKAIKVEGASVAPAAGNGSAPADKPKARGWDDGASTKGW